MRKSVALGVSLAAFLLVAAAWLRSDRRRRLHDAPVNGVDDQEAQVWSEQARRVRLLEEACASKDRDVLGPHYLGSRSNRRLGKPTHCPPHLCPIFVDDRRKVALCFVPKVASTSLKSLFASLLRINATSSKGDDDDDALHALFNERVFRIGPTHWPRSKLRQYTRVLFVRHPFERLVSAFEDKAGGPRDRERFFYDVYWDRIMAGSRSSNATDNSTRVTFPQFVDYLLRVPVSQWDDHWAPFYSRCEPCLFRYNFVGHLETAGKDMALLWRRMGLPPPESSTLERRNAKPRRHRRYFDQLTASQVEGLYRRYFYDFVLFGYDHRGYLSSEGTPLRTR
ncbi:carbohydrate sulfotransferase 8-like [Dermacentor andersoni]|uniref:carbohydrate sulfotransferase 8-like n=1 Tax=Dermacentor andersoni TaxID=34620 RepID=UPI0021559B44|nr:carbohydrate sulfotransferase 8-like [Dermacentor andersoni]